MFLFNNKKHYIVTDGNPIFYTQWFEKVIFSIQEILDDTEKLLSFNGFHQKKKSVALKANS